MLLKLTSLLKPVGSTLIKGLAESALGLGVVKNSLPVLTESLVKRILNHLPGFIGSVGSIQFHLLSGRIEINDFVLDKKITREMSEPFLNVPRIILALRWKYLLHKQAVGNIEIQSPRIWVDVQNWKPRDGGRPDVERKVNTAAAQ